MFSIKDVKKKGKSSLGRSYFNKVFICIFAMIFIGLFASTKSDLLYGKQELIKIFPKLETVESRINQFQFSELTNTKKGAFKYIFDKTNEISIYSSNVLNNLENYLYVSQNDEKVVILFLFVFILSLVFKIVVTNLLEVGINRFFLESRSFNKPKWSRIFFLFKNKNYFNVVKVMFIKNIKLLLWACTIVGGFIKYYSYRMVPYILAERPDLDYKRTIKLSCEMMNGNKFRMFIYDISFVFYHILNSLSFGLVGVFFLNPYLKSSEAEIFVSLRNKKKYQKILNDDKLYKLTDYDYYPGVNKDEKVYTTHQYNYSFTTFILFFFSFAIVGWLWEVILMFYKGGKFINRGTLFGPWLPVYGFGCLFVLLFFLPKKTRRLIDNPILTFLLIILICGVIEYIGGFSTEYFKCLRYWNYDGYFLNIHGRVCFECSLFFGFGGMICIYIIAPILNKFFLKISKKMTYILCIVLTLLFVGDFIYSHYHPNVGAGITSTVSASRTNSPFCKVKK